MSSRQGSASFTIVLGGVAALIVGGLLLTFLVYPIFNAFTGAAFWGADTSDGARVVKFVEAIWEFWGGIILIAILSFVWIRTRQ